MMTHRGHLFVLSAPSGTGKSTLIARLCQEVPNVWHSISMTTRTRRPSERDGTHYHFLDKTQFQAMIAKNGLLEWAQVYEEYYGTPRDEVDAHLARGDDVLLDLDVQGALQVKRLRTDVILVFIMPPSLEELSRRLETRATETAEKIRTRLSVAEEEMAQNHLYDHVVINEDADAAFGELKDIILKRRAEADPL